MTKEELKVFEIQKLKEKFGKFHSEETISELFEYRENKEAKT
jgi:hypothetical protein